MKALLEILTYMRMGHDVLHWRPTPNESYILFGLRFVPQKNWRLHSVGWVGGEGVLGVTRARNAGAKPVARKW